MYGISAVGITASSARVLQSTAAQHLRKLLRVHEHGHSNADVLQQAALPLLPELCDRLAGQARTLDRDVHRSAALRQYEEERLTQLQWQVQTLQNSGHSQAMTQEHESTIAQLTCPVCGVYFGTAEGLHLHLHRQHPEVEQASKLRFSRAKHSLFGLPYCRFCRSRLGSWPALTKHVTQGWCLRIKLAVGKGQSLESLLEEIQAEEERDPPQPPVLCTLRSFILNMEIKQLSHQCSILRQCDNMCLLCGQRLQQVSRTKAHWRSSHPAVWTQVHAHAASETQSLSAIMRRPCVLCGSQAKNTKLHAKQCPVLFQIVSLRWMHKAGIPLELDADHKPQASRKFEAEPQYKSFVSPVLSALTQGGARGRHKTVTMDTNQQAALKVDEQRSKIRTIAEMTQARANVGTIRQFFRPQPQQTHTRQEANAEMAWYFRLRLTNPHSLCYVNAAILALLHCIREAGLDPVELQFLQKVGIKAADRGINLLLTQMHRFRCLTPHWQFTAEQKDTSEFLHELFAHLHSMQVIWDTRRRTDEGIRLFTQGVQPVQIPIPNNPRQAPLQALITAWHQDNQDVTALTYHAPVLVLQLGRYSDQGKSFCKVDLPLEVQIPVFQDDSSVQWSDYTVSSLILHLGRSTNVGHYRALLRAGSSWFLTDDSRVAERINLHDGHFRNSYVIMLSAKRADSHACDVESAPTWL